MDRLSPFDRRVGMVRHGIASKEKCTWKARAEGGGGDGEICTQLSYVYCSFRKKTEGGGARGLPSWLAGWVAYLPCLDFCGACRVS